MTKGLPKACEVLQSLQLPAQIPAKIFPNPHCFDRHSQGDLVLRCGKFQRPKRSPAPPEHRFCTGACIPTPPAACHLRHAFFELVLCHVHMAVQQKKHILRHPEEFSVEICQARDSKRGEPWGKHTTDTGNQNAGFSQINYTCL